MREELTRRLTEIDSQLLAMGITTAYLQQEKELVKTYIYNPNQENLETLEKFRESTKQFFMGLAG